MEKKKKLLRNENGFTLLEIIAILILLAALAAAAVPRYIELTEEARQKGALAAVAEGGVQVNAAAAHYILEFNRVPTSVDDLRSLSKNPLRDITGEGDWDITFTDGQQDTPSVKVTATGREEGPSNIPGTVSKSRDFPLPRETAG
jgi:MSHA pilin protein MshA